MCSLIHRLTQEAKRHPADFFTDGRIRFLIDPEQKTEEGESYSR